MTKTVKIILTTLILVFFSISTLEIDVFGCENSFFDHYDSYVKVDSKVTHRILQVEFNKQAVPEIIFPSFAPAFVLFSANPNDEHSFLRPSKRKLFLVKSSLLI